MSAEITNLSTETTDNVENQALKAEPKISEPIASTSDQKIHAQAEKQLIAGIDVDEQLGTQIEIAPEEKLTKKTPELPADISNKVPEAIKQDAREKGVYDFVEKFSPDDKKAWLESASAADKEAYEYYQRRVEAGDLGFLNQVSDATFDTYLKDENGEYSDKHIDAYMSYTARVTAGDYSFVDKLSPADQDKWLKEADPADRRGYEAYSSRTLAGDYSSLEKLYKASKENPDSDEARAYADWLKAPPTEKERKDLSIYMDNIQNGNYSFVDHLNKNEKEAFLKDDNNRSAYDKFKKQINEGDFYAIDNIGEEAYQDWRTRNPEEAKRYDIYQEKMLSNCLDFVEQMPPESQREWLSRPENAAYYKDYLDLKNKGDYSYLDYLSDAALEEVLVNASSDDYSKMMDYMFPPPTVVELPIDPEPAGLPVDNSTRNSTANSSYSPVPPAKSEIPSQDYIPVPPAPYNPPPYGIEPTAPAPEAPPPSAPPVISLPETRVPDSSTRTEREIRDPFVPRRNKIPASSPSYQDPADRHPSHPDTNTQPHPGTIVPNTPARSNIIVGRPDTSANPAPPVASEVNNHHPGTPVSDLPPAPINTGGESKLPTPNSSATGRLSEIQEQMANRRVVPAPNLPPSMPDTEITPGTQEQKPNNPIKVREKTPDIITGIPEAVRPLPAAPVPATPGVPTDKLPTIPPGEGTSHHQIENPQSPDSKSPQPIKDKPAIPGTPAGSDIPRPGDIATPAPTDKITDPNPPKHTEQSNLPAQPSSPGQITPPADPKTRPEISRDTRDTKDQKDLPGPQELPKSIPTNTNTNAPAGAPPVVPQPATNPDPLRETGIDRKPLPSTLERKQQAEALREASTRTNDVIATNPQPPTDQKNQQPAAPVSNIPPVIAQPGPAQPQTGQTVPPAMEKPALPKVENTSPSKAEQSPLAINTAAGHTSKPEQQIPAQTIQNKELPAQAKPEQSSPPPGKTETPVVKTEVIAENRTPAKTDSHEKGEQNYRSNEPKQPQVVIDNKPPEQTKATITESPGQSRTGNSLARDNTASGDARLAPIALPGKQEQPPAQQAPKDSTATTQSSVQTKDNAPNTQPPAHTKDSISNTQTSIQAKDNAPNTQPLAHTKDSTSNTQTSIQAKETAGGSISRESTSSSAKDSGHQISGRDNLTPSPSGREGVKQDLTTKDTLPSPTKENSVARDHRVDQQPAQRIYAESAKTSESSPSRIINEKNPQVVHQEPTSSGKLPQSNATPIHTNNPNPVASSKNEPISNIRNSDQETIKEPSKGLPIGLSQMGTQSGGSHGQQHATQKDPQNTVPSGPGNSIGSQPINLPTLQITGTSDPNQSQSTTTASGTTPCATGKEPATSGTGTTTGNSGTASTSTGSGGRSTSTGVSTSANSSSTGSANTAGNTGSANSSSSDPANTAGNTGSANSSSSDPASTASGAGSASAGNGGGSAGTGGGSSTATGSGSANAASNSPGDTKNSNEALQEQASITIPPSGSSIKFAAGLIFNANQEQIQSRFTSSNTEIVSPPSIPSSTGQAERIQEATPPKDNYNETIYPAPQVDNTNLAPEPAAQPFSQGINDQAVVNRAEPASNTHPDIIPPEYTGYNAQPAVESPRQQALEAHQEAIADIATRNTSYDYEQVIADYSDMRNQTLSNEVMEAGRQSQLQYPDAINSPKETEREPNSPASGSVTNGSAGSESPAYENSFPPVYTDNSTTSPAPVDVPDMPSLPNTIPVEPYNPPPMPYIDTTPETEQDNIPPLPGPIHGPISIDPAAQAEQSQALPVIPDVQQSSPIPEIILPEKEEERTKEPDYTRTTEAVSQPAAQESQNTPYMMPPSREAERLHTSDTQEQIEKQPEQHRQDQQIEVRQPQPVEESYSIDVESSQISTTHNGIILTDEQKQFLLQEVFRTFMEGQLQSHGQSQHHFQATDARTDLASLTSSHARPEQSALNSSIESSHQEPGIKRIEEYVQQGLAIRDFLSEDGLNGLISNYLQTVAADTIKEHVPIKELSTQTEAIVQGIQNLSPFDFIELVQNTVADNKNTHTTDSKETNQAAAPVNKIDALIQSIFNPHTPDKFDQPAESNRLAQLPINNIANVNTGSESEDAKFGLNEEAPFGLMAGQLPDEDKIRYDRLEQERRRLQEEEARRRDHEDKEREEKARRHMEALLSTARAQARQQQIQPTLPQDLLLSSQKYIVLPGDTLESIAKKKLKDRRLAPLLYEINKDKIEVRVEGGRPLLLLLPKTILRLPSGIELQKYRSGAFRRPFRQFEYAQLPDNKLTGEQGNTQDSTFSNAQARKRRTNIENILGPIQEEQTDLHINYICRLGDSLRSVAMRHPALRNVSLWKLLAQVNNLPLDTDRKGIPLAELRRGQKIILPTPQQIAEYMQAQTNSCSSSRLVQDKQISSGAATGTTIGTGTSGSYSVPTKECPNCSRSTVETARVCPACAYAFMAPSQQLPNTAADMAASQPPSSLANQPATTIDNTLEISRSGLENKDVPATFLHKLEDTAAEAEGYKWLEVRNVITDMSADCRIIRYGNLGSNAIGFRSRLEVRTSDIWIPLLEYEINEEFSWQHEYSRLGHKKSTKIDLPPRQAKEIAESHLQSNWQDLSQAFFAAYTAKQNKDSSPD